MSRTSQNCQSKYDPLPSHVWEIFLKNDSAVSFNIYLNIYLLSVLQQGVIAELRVVGDPRAAERQCEEDDDDSDMVSDC